MKNFKRGIDNDNYSDSGKQPYPIGENNKDIINNIKNKNNYKRNHTQRIINLILNREIMQTMTLLNYMQMLVPFHKLKYLHIENQWLY